MVAQETEKKGWMSTVYNDGPEGEQVSRALGLGEPMLAAIPTTKNEHFRLYLMALGNGFCHCFLEQPGVL